MNDTVIELIDESDDEMYYTLGLYRDVESAMELLRSINDPNSLPSLRGDEASGACKISLVRRSIEPTNDTDSVFFKRIGEINYTEEYNEETDEYYWYVAESKMFEQST